MSRDGSSSEDALNPLEAYDQAIRTLMALCQVRNNQIRFAAAEKLLEYTAHPPNLNFDFEPDPEE